jgi:hypothetical protein
VIYRSEPKVIKTSSIDQGSLQVDNIPTTQPQQRTADITNDNKATTPKLSNANDPFFFDETPTAKRPTKGIQSLMRR